MPMGERDDSRKGQVVRGEANLDGVHLPLEILQTQRRAKTVNLKAARIIVTGGAGVGSRDSFKLIWDLANVLGGAVGGSRAAVDLGFVDHDHQVGQTGTTVRPALYIAVGVSGAVQHRAGMQESARILAINNDPDAPIFSIAHYGVVGDLNAVVPRLIKTIRGGVDVVRAARQVADA
jgi:electron transfer flavoprotein alpha subunit